MTIAKACGVCGARVPTGHGRCENCRGRSGRHPISCRVCGILSPKSYCPEHEPDWKNRPEKERTEKQPWRSGYRDPAYYKERQAALRRAGGACENCGRSDLPLECDHIVPLSKGGVNHRDNMRILCQTCHRLKTRKRG